MSFAYFIHVGVAYSTQISLQKSHILIILLQITGYADFCVVLKRFIDISQNTCTLVCSCVQSLFVCVRSWPCGCEYTI